jgi:CheY-like chemotaxis protein
LSGARVLLLDDDETVSLTLAAILERAGLQVTRFERAEAALQALHDPAGGFEIVLTDHTMPGMTGLEFARQAAQSWPGVPVVMMSGYITDELRQAAGAIGIRALLNKENAFAELLSVVQAALASQDKRLTPRSGQA